MENIAYSEDFDGELYTDGPFSLDDIDFVPIDQPLEKIHYFKNTVHFKRRKLDKQYEIIGLSSGRPDHLENSDNVGNRWITLAVVPTHDEALKEIKRLRQ